jgi:hypothetical protein
MIRHPIPAPELQARIQTAYPRWPGKAKKRAELCRKAKGFVGDTKLWGEIKSAYMELQHNKCAYCERRLEGPPYGAIEHDIEHFRPKNSVEAWPTDRIREERGITYAFKTGATWSGGYYLLAFHPGNYVTACKSCNSTLKANYFPIAGKRGPQVDDPMRLLVEEPFLIYPLGDFDDDPENVITFEGLVPKPRARSGRRHERAQVIIDFFELDTREELLRGRAEQIRTMMLALIVAEKPPAPEAKSLADHTIARLQDLDSPHCNCVRSFRRLYQQDRARAQSLFHEVLDYLNSLVVGVQN